MNAADKWNESHPVGASVTVRRDNGDTLHTQTRSEAWMLGRRGVVLVDGISGCYTLERMTPTEGGAK